MEKQKTIGFISYADPKDKTAWSGTIHHLYNSIENSGYNVIWIKARFSKWIKYYQKFLNRLSKQSNKHYSIAHTLLAAYLTRLDKKDFKKADILFSPGCTAIYKLKTDKPIIYLADATFKSIHNYYDEFSTKEIAKILDIPQGTVKSRLARGRKQLKDLLEMEGEGAYEGA